MFDLRKLKREGYLVSFILALTISVATAVPVTSQSAESDLTEKITNNDPANDVVTDGIAGYAGTFGPVVDVGGCTGTIIAPHAVLTAAHCSPAPRLSYWGFGGTLIERLNSSGSVLSPHSRATPDFRPWWWVDLHNQNLTDRPDDWPAMHDLRIGFFPDLTPEFLNARGLLPITATRDPLRTQPGYRASQLQTVGVCSGTCTRRRYAPALLIPSLEGYLRQDRVEPRDGYYGLSRSESGYARIDPGDSGGPIVESSVFSWDGDTYAHRHRVVATHHNSRSELSPINLTLSLEPTWRQAEAVRLNETWVAAWSADADRDGLAGPCDPEPGETRANVLGRCPGRIGAPLDPTHPRGLTQCPAGWYATGLYGKAGALVDRIGLRCEPASCIGNNASCGDPRFNSTTFGGPGGTDFILACPTDHILVGIDAHTDSNNSQRPTSLRARCRAFENGQPDGPVVTTARVGSVLQGAQLAIRDCPASDALVGLDARSSDVGSTNQPSTRVVTTLRPVCDDPPPVFAGGSGGVLHPLLCPDGTNVVGVGAVPGSSAIAGFSVYCGRPEETSPGTNSERLHQIHSSHQDASSGFHPSGTWPFSWNFPERAARNYAPFVPARELAFCPIVDGKRLRVTGVRYSVGTQTLRLVRAIERISCSDGEGGPVTHVPVGVGVPTSESVERTCRGGFEGALARSGSLLDALAMVCPSNIVSAESFESATLERWSLVVTN